ncbi:hypothetical protein FIBSPDRAFT_927140 [Athelia psychrophila]|uniref:Uncharacterized protein n=1 Tax=Athelia psychrophila TaxID=1759441 RepID=A0A166S5A6_9AGAM|nr:hypothetical protein FIBSPDRAFT_927140 [Fibularhizoctonia sp. CBS 109695]
MSALWTIINKAEFHRNYWGHHSSFASRSLQTSLVLTNGTHGLESRWSEQPSAEKSRPNPPNPVPRGKCQKVWPVIVAFIAAGVAGWGRSLLVATNQRRCRGSGTLYFTSVRKAKNEPFTILRFRVRGDEGRRRIYRKETCKGLGGHPASVGASKLIGGSNWHSGRL